MSRAGLTSFLEMCEKHRGSSGLLAVQQLAICGGEAREKDKGERMLPCESGNHETRKFGF